MMRALTIATLLIGFALASTPAFASERTAEVELLDALERALPWPDAQASVADVRVIGAWPAAPRSYELPDTSRLGEHLRVRVTGGNGDTAWITARLALEVPVYVAASALQRGESAAGRAMIELRAMTSLPSDAVLGDQALDDRVARVTIREGDVLRDLSLENPMLVERQQIVDVMVVRGAIVVHTRGVALEPGRRGDVIRVRSATSETVFTAMVQSIGRVEVP